MSHNGIRSLSWPTNFPDPNIIENVSDTDGLRDNRQFSNVEEHIKDIREVWKSLSVQYLRKLYGGLEKRIFQVVDWTVLRTSTITPSKNGTILSLRYNFALRDLLFPWFFISPLREVYLKIVT